MVLNLSSTIHVFRGPAEVEADLNDGDLRARALTAVVVSSDTLPSHADPNLNQSHVNGPSTTKFAQYP